MISYLNVLLVLEQRCLHDVSQGEGLGLDVEGVSGQLSDAVPVTGLHGLVGHQLQQRTTLVEVIDRLLQVLERLPVLQSSRKFAASVENMLFKHSSIVRIE